MTVLEARNVWKVYKSGTVEWPALRGVDLDVEQGEFVAIMGPSGSGKSTLLHLLGGLDTPTRGEIRVEGKDLARLSDDQRTILRRTRIGFVFQAFNLLPPLTAEENVMFPLLVGEIPAREARRRALERLAQVGLADRRAHFPAQLSGGEQQRVAVARAMVVDPVLVIADEPTGALDTETGRRLLDLLQSLVGEQGHTILIVTHDPSVAARAQRTIHLRDGKVETELSDRASPAGAGRTACP
jgi:putative ABC transport system ATP-binding protein